MTDTTDTTNIDRLFAGAEEASAEEFFAALDIGPELFRDHVRRTHGSGTRRCSNPPEPATHDHRGCVKPGSP